MSAENESEENSHYADIELDLPAEVMSAEPFSPDVIRGKRKDSLERDEKLSDSASKDQLMVIPKSKIKTRKKKKKKSNLGSKLGSNLGSNMPIALQKYSFVNTTE